MPKNEVYPLVVVRERQSSHVTLSVTTLLTVRVGHFYTIRKRKCNDNANYVQVVGLTSEGAVCKAAKMDGRKRCEVAKWFPEEITVDYRDFLEVC